MAEHAHTTPTPAVRRAAPPWGGVCDRRGITPTVIRSAALITPAQRLAIERDIERKIDFLNALDGNPDMEAGVDDERDWDDEPSDGTDPDAAWLDPADGHGLRPLSVFGAAA